MRLAPRPPLLAGREELLAALDARLVAGDGSGPRIVSLCGLGGAGKTSVAVEYAYRHLGEAGVAWQFAAEDAAVLEAGFGELAAQLGTRGLADARDPVASVHAVLARFPMPFLPPAGPGRVLITSQNPNWPRQPLDVPVLDSDVAARFLVSRTGDPDRQAAWDLAGILGGLPLALEQAAAHMQATGDTLAGYLALFRRRRAEMLARGEPTGYSKTVASTWALAFDRLRQTEPGAAGVGLLRLLAFCAPEAIPLRLLLRSRPALATRLGDEVIPVLAPLLEDPLAASDAIGALRRYSLVIPAADGSVSLHRLVQAVTVDQMPAELARKWQQATAALIEDAIPGDTGQPETWPVCAALLPHAQAALADDSDGIARIGHYLKAKREWEQQFGRYKEVRELAAGIIYVLDSGIISRSVILDVTERLAIRAPRYWLAPAVLAVAAWLDDDKNLYFDSINSALALDHSKTALFMTLLLRHQARTEVMRQWISSYLTGLDPVNLPTDFAVVIEAVAGGTLGADSAPQLATRMRDWYEHAARSRDVEAEEIGQWERNLLSLAAAGDYAEQFPVLAQSSPTWELLRKRHEANTAIEAADQHFRSRFDDGAEVPADLDEKISVLLRHLAEDPDSAENKVLRMIRRAEAVIETQDDAAAERKVAADEADRARALNIVSLVTRAAFPSGRKQSPTMTELLTIVLSQRFIDGAAESIHYKHRRFDTVDVNLGQRRATFSCTTDAEVTAGALGRQAEYSAEELAGEIDYQIFEQGKKLRRPASGRLITAAVLSCGLLAAAIVVGPTSGLGIFILAVALVILGAGALDRFPLLRRRLRNITDHGAQEKRSIKRALTQASDELASLFSQEQRSNDLLPALQAYLLGLTADDVYRATRFTAPPPQILMLPGPPDREMSGDADSTVGNEDGYARGFPEWTPWPPTRAR